MSGSKFALMSKFSVIIVGVFGLAVCAWWYPLSVSLTSAGIVDVSVTLAQSIEFWLQLLFYWAVSIPCFAVLVIAWLIANTMKREQFFSRKVANMVKLSAVIMLVDVVVFIIGNVVFCALGWNDFALVYFSIAALGLVVAFAYFVMYHYLSEAVYYKEEADGLI